MLNHENHQCNHHEKNIRGSRLLWVTLLNALVTIVEFFGGIFSNSLALISDAVHNLGDTSALLFAYIANIWGKKKANINRTFGYKRIEILTALINAIILIVICVFLIKEAYFRFYNPEPIKGVLMLLVAILGLIVNLVSTAILHRDKNKNIKAAYLHLLGDTLSSVAVIIGGVAIWIWNLVWLDPLITLFVAVYIIFHTWRILKQAIDIIMQSKPKDINVNEIIDQVLKIQNIKDIHHLHIWQLNETQIHFEAHVNLNDNINMIRVMEVRK